MNMHNRLPDPVSADVFSFPAGDDSARSGRRRWLVPAIIVAAIVLAAVALWRVYGAKPAATEAKTTVAKVTVMVPGTTRVTDAVTASGSIAARRDSAVGIQGDGGRVVEVLVEPGQSVKKGQILARIDKTVQIQQSLQLAATVRSAQADAALAEANLRRAEALVGKGFISKADIDQRSATRDGANAKVALAKAQLAEANAKLDRLDVRAPAAGLVLSRAVETGQVVSPGGGAMFRVAEGGILEMRALVAEQDMARLKAGMSATVTPVGSATGYPGKIWLLDPVIDAVSRQGIARIALAYSPGLRVGAFARARIDAGEAIRPVLPQSAVQSDDAGNFVFVVGSDKKVVRRAVTVGTVTDDGVSIASGIAGDEHVVLSAGAFLRPGETIDPVLARSAG